MLAFYDENLNAFGSDSLKSTHNGHRGDFYDVKIYIRNNDLTQYYTTVSLAPVSSTYDDIMAEWGETGFGIKLLNGENRPTEIEWDQVRSGEEITIPDFGTTLTADTTTYYPVWARIICPGQTAAQLKNNLSLKLSCLTKQVGS